MSFFKSAMDIKQVQKIEKMINNQLLKTPWNEWIQELRAEVQITQANPSL